MNEPSNQLNGVNGTCPDTSLDYPPVIIGGEALFTYTACMSDRYQNDSMKKLAVK